MNYPSKEGYANEIKGAAWAKTVNRLIGKDRLIDGNLGFRIMQQAADQGWDDETIRDALLRKSRPLCA